MENLFLLLPGRVYGNSAWELVSLGMGVALGLAV
jgi:hypothetical protein